MRRGVQGDFKNVSQQPTRLLLSYTPGDFEPWFLDIGTPVTASDEKPHQIKLEHNRRTVSAAGRYGANFEKK